MSPQEIASSLKSLRPEQLGVMDWGTLLEARRHVPMDQQNAISPYEHRAYARETVRENPMSALGIAVGTLGYQPYKAIMQNTRSKPSLDQLGQGLYGVGEGLWGAFQDQTKSIQDRIKGINTDSSAIVHLSALQSYLPNSNKANTPRQ